MCANHDNTARPNMVKVQIKFASYPSIQDFVLELDPTTTVSELKDKTISHHKLLCNADSLFAIKKGRKLNDNDPIETGNSSEVRIYMSVDRNKFPGSIIASSSPSTQAGAPASSNGSARAGAQNPTGFAAGARGAGGEDPMMSALMNNPSLMANMSNMAFDKDFMANAQQMLMNNPEMVKNMMNSPSVQAALNNPEIMQNVLKSGPMKEVLDKNPELNQIMNDPELIKQILSTQSSKAAADQMNIQNDLALRQIENLGAFNQVERMYNDVSGALEKVADEQNPLMVPSNQNVSTTGVTPNPWNPTATTAAPAFSSRSNVSPSLNNMMLRQNSLASMLASAPSTVKVTSENINTVIASNPMYLQHITSLSNAILKLHAHKPNFCRSYFSPFQNSSLYELLKNCNITEITDESDMAHLAEHAHDSQTMRSIADILQVVKNIAFISSDDSFFKIYFVPNKNSEFGLACEKILAGRASNGPTINPIAQQLVAAQSSKDPKELYAKQIEMLKGMGFKDEAKIIEALKQANGDIHASLDFL